REMSWMPYLQSPMILKILSMRTSLASAISSAHRGRRSQSRTAKTIASKSGLYCGSNGQLMNTLLSYSFRAIGHRLLPPITPAGGDFSDRLQNLGMRDRTASLGPYQHALAFHLRAHRVLSISDALM